MINPMVVEGQIAGGVVQGIGGVLYEDFVYDDDGNPLTTTFLDYLLPTAPEVPTIEYGHIVTPSAPPRRLQGHGRGRRHRRARGRRQRGGRRARPLGVVLTDQPLTPAALVQAISSAANA